MCIRDRFLIDKKPCSDALNRSSPGDILKSAISSLFTGAVGICPVLSGGSKIMLQLPADFRQGKDN